MWQIILAGVVAVAVGSLYSVFGYRLFRFLLPLWSFLVGMGVGASFTDVFMGTGFLGTVGSWIIAIVVGLIFGGFAYFFFKLSMVLLGASVGAGVATYLAQTFGMQPGFASNMVALVGALALAALVLSLNAERALIIMLTAAAGATGIVTGVLLWLGRLNLTDLGTSNVLQPILSNSWMWLISWLVVLALGVIIQMRRPPPEQMTYA